MVVEKVNVSARQKNVTTTHPVDATFPKRVAKNEAVRTDDVRVGVYLRRHQ